MLGFIVGEGVFIKYNECENFLYWRNEYNKTQAKIMRFPIHKVNSAECKDLIKFRENAFNEMQKYRIN